MNRIILLVLMLTTMSARQASAQATAQTTAQATAQEEAVGHFTYCPYVAIFYSPYSTGNMSALTTRVQAGFGFETEYRFTKVIGISAGLELANFGVKGNSVLNDRYGPAFSVEKEYKMKTLGLPLMLNLHPLASNRLSLRAGLQPGWLLQTSYDNISSGSMCFAIPVGVAVGLSDRVALELRGHIGTTNFEDNERNSGLYQRTLALHLTYVIN